MTETNRELARDLGRESLEDVLNLLDLRPAWQTRAVCHGATDEFFTVPKWLTAEAHEADVRARFCDRCPVAQPCSEAKKDNLGIWGKS